MESRNGRYPELQRKVGRGVERSRGEGEGVGWGREEG
jgi:hypothetical protein